MDNHPRNFALQFGAFITLYVSLSALLTLIFSTVNLAMPDATDTFWNIENYQSTLKFSLAVLFVFFPAFIVLTRKVNNLRRSQSGAYVLLTRWVLYLSLLAGSLVILGDLVILINTFLNGEITERFLLKSVLLLAILGLTLYYYLLDAKGYWITNEKQSKLYAAGMAGIVIAVLIASLSYVETPYEAREKKLDDTQVTDIQNIYYKVNQYYIANETLPENIGNAYLSDEVPTAPEGRPEYSYTTTGEFEYEVCAEFAFASDVERETFVAIEPLDIKKSTTPDWSHKAGNWCYELSVAHE